MSQDQNTQWTITEYDVNSYLLTWIEAFIIDRRAQNFAKGTISFYRWKLRYFTDFCELQHIKDIRQIDPPIIRQYLMDSGKKGIMTGEYTAPTGR